MFVYERNGKICVTFQDNKPVDVPEYVIVVDKESGTISVNGTTVEVQVPISSAEDLADAIANGQVTLGDDIDLSDEHITVSKDEADIELDGNGKTVSVGQSAFNNKDGLEGIASGRISIKDTVFKGDVETLGTGFATVLGFDSNVDVEFDGCTFDSLWAAVCYNPSKAGNHSTITFKNCVFASNLHAAVSNDPTTDEGTYDVKFENCTMNGVPEFEFPVAKAVETKSETPDEVDEVEDPAEEDEADSE